MTGKITKEEIDERLEERSTFLSFTFPRPRTVYEYELLREYVLQYMIIDCVECSTPFEWVTNKRRPPKFCSDECRLIHRRTQNRLAQRKWKVLNAGAEI